MHSLLVFSTLEFSLDVASLWASILCLLFIIVSKDFECELALLVVDVLAHDDPQLVFCSVFLSTYVEEVGLEVVPKRFLQVVDICKG